MIVCYVIEDSPIIANALEQYIEKTPFLTIGKMITDMAQENILDMLSQERPDIVFINPELLNCLKAFVFNEKCILVFIASAFEDYLVKVTELPLFGQLAIPITYASFLKELQRLI